MKKIWRVFRFEYIRRIRTKGFLFAVISMPLIIVLAAGLGFLSSSMQTNKLPVGFLDKSNLLEEIRLPNGRSSFSAGTVRMIPFSALETGKEAVRDGSIQAFFVLPPDYLASGNIEAYMIEKPGGNAYAALRLAIKTSLIQEMNPMARERVNTGSNLTVQSLDGMQSANMRDWFIIFFPFASGLVFMIVINISGGYLLQSVVDEKENRTMEVIVTSVSPGQLMVGKILGNLSVGFTQALIWFGGAAGGMAVLQAVLGFGQRPGIQPVHFVLFFGIIMPGFILIAALMTIVGAAAAEMREAQQISLLFTLPMAAPFGLASAILQHPGNPLTVFLSIFPFTSIVTMPLRISISTVPASQIAAAVAIVWVSAAAALALAARAFRLGMLNYGKRIRLGMLIQCIAGEPK